MITAQDIREISFDNARINGYDKAAVDDFLEALADDVTATQKENAVLKTKMKVLVDKIEEYRANEDAVQQAVLSAQKLAIQIENDARTRAAAMLADADRQVKAQVGSITEQVEREEKRLADAKAATGKFFEGIRALCNAQMKNMDKIAEGMEIARPEAAKPAEKADVEDAVRSIDDSVSRIQPEPDVNIDLEPASKPLPRSRQPKNFDSTQAFSF